MIAVCVCVCVAKPSFSWHPSILRDIYADTSKKGNYYLLCPIILGCNKVGCNEQKIIPFFYYECLI